MFRAFERDEINIKIVKTFFLKHVFAKYHLQNYFKHACFNVLGNKFTHNSIEELQKECLSERIFTQFVNDVVSPSSVQSNISL